MILAALLHHIGVINHDDLGSLRLAERGFSSRLRTLVLGHVDAKRYLVATNADYAKRLSPASTQTVIHQGGPMSIEEATAFGEVPELKDCYACAAGTSKP